MNKKTDCWRCGQTFGEPIKIGFIDGKILHAYHKDDILCTDCMDIEQMDR